MELGKSKAGPSRLPERMPSHYMMWDRRGGKMTGGKCGHRRMLAEVAIWMSTWMSLRTGVSFAP